MTRVSLVLAAALLAACSTRDARRGSSDASRQFLSQIDSTCDFVTSPNTQMPSVLVREFATRASRAEFDHTEPWLPSVTTCPGHEPGYDMFAVVDSFSVQPLDSARDSVRIVLLRDVIGSESSGHFYRDRRRAVDTLLVVHTPFGWRIDNPVWNWETESIAYSRHAIRDTVDLDSVPERTSER